MIGIKDWTEQFRPGLSTFFVIFVRMGPDSVFGAGYRISSIHLEEISLGNVKKRVVLG